MDLQVTQTAGDKQHQSLDELKEIAEDDEEIVGLNTALNDGVIFVLGTMIPKAGENRGGGLSS